MWTRLSESTLKCSVDDCRKHRVQFGSSLNLQRLERSYFFSNLSQCNLSFPRRQRYLVVEKVLRI